MKKSRKLDLPLDLQLDLFDKLIKPVLLYGSEVWAFAPLGECDKTQLRYLKLILNVKKSTPTCMVLGELGCLPVSLDAKCRTLCFWYNLFLQYKEGKNKISILLFRLANALYGDTEVKIPWLHNIKTLLDNLGLSYIWDFQCNYSALGFKKLVKQRLTDQYYQTWKQNVYENSICTSYRIFKEEHKFEKYLIDLPIAHRNNILKFRLSCHRLPIQKQRYLNIDRNDRLCDLCDKQELGDEFHYLFNCSNAIISDNRKRLLPRYFQHHPNILKLHQLLNTKSKKCLLNVSRFVKVIFDVVK